MEFRCPHCHEIITEKDLESSQLNASHLKEYFLKKEDQYKKEFNKNLAQDIKQENETQINALKQKIEKEYQNKILQKELEIQKAKQIEIDSIKQLLHEQEIKIKNNQNENQKIIAQKELEIQKAKQVEVDDIKKILQEKEIQLKNQQSATQIIMLQKELEIKNGMQIEIDTLKNAHIAENNKLQKSIQELEKANALNRVIQSKTKGENFEHDVEKILRETFEPEDIIKKITSADKKADYLHIVRNNDEKNIGKIVYEVKNAEWKDTWEKKLTEDMAKENSKYGILIATSFNKKYPGIMFKRSDENANIYLVDSDSFIFIGQVVKSLIKTEFKIEQRYQGKEFEEKKEDFKKWKDTQIPAINKIIQENITRIEKAENSIAKQINEIRIGREKIYDQWIDKIKNYIENIIL